MNIIHQAQNPQWGILGLGYVGMAFSRNGKSLKATQRTPTVPGTLPFVLEDITTWSPVLKALESTNAVLWTFPAATHMKQKSLATQFASQMGNKPLFILGTTSRYLVEAPGQWATEETPLLDTPRSVAEEALRQEIGATVLALSGIWGPNRDPTLWLKKGLIPSGQGYINLINVMDICQIIQDLYPIAHSVCGQLFNLTSTPQLWGEVAQKLKSLGKLDEHFSFPNPSKEVTGKQVSHSKIKAILPHFVFKNFP